VCIVILLLTTDAIEQYSISTCEENDQCVCHGRVYYGRKYRASESSQVTSLRDLSEGKHLSKEVSGPYDCSKKAFREDPAHGLKKHCICSPAELFDPPLCAPLDTRESPSRFRVAIGFYGLSQNLRITLPTYKQHIFAVLHRSDVLFDVFSSTVQLPKNLVGKNSYLLHDEYSMRLMRPCSVSLTPMEAIVDQLDHHNGDITSFHMHMLLQYSRADLGATINSYSATKGVDYDALLVLRPDAVISKNLDLPSFLTSRTFSSSHLYVPTVYDSADRAAFGAPALMYKYLCTLGEVRHGIYSGLKATDGQLASVCGEEAHSTERVRKAVRAFPTKKSVMHVSGVKRGLPLPLYDPGPPPRLLGPRLCHSGRQSGEKHQESKKDKVYRVAIGFFGMSRNLRITLPTIQKHVFDVFERHNIVYDVFWSTVTAPVLNNPRSFEVNMKIDEYDVRLLRPCVTNLIPMFKVLHETVFNFSKISPTYHYANKETVKNIFCSFHTQKILDKSIKAYSKAHKVSYDAVVALRPDAAVIRDIGLAELLSTQKFSSGHIYIPNFAHFQGINDRAAYGSPDVMSVYFNRDEAFKISLATSTLKWVVNTETFLKHYLQDRRVPVKMTDMRVMRVRVDGQIPKNDYDKKKMSMPKAEIARCQMMVVLNSTSMENITVLDTTFC